MSPMRVRWGSKSRFWVEIYNSRAKRFVAMKAKDVPDWVLRCASADELRSKRETLKCVEGGGLYFMPGQGHEFKEELKITNPEISAELRPELCRYHPGV